MELRNFYKFFKLDNLITFQKAILRKGVELEIKGTILLAEEGINASVSAYSSEFLQQFQAYIEEILCTTFTPIVTNLSKTDPHNSALPFRKLKVKIRKDIVTLGVAGLDPACTTGFFVEPKDWNDLISDPNTITIDTRNIYEYHLGHFKNAINPNTPNFTDFVSYAKEQIALFNSYTKVAMYCTGGIRCEKASSMMIQELGIKNTFQLHGGILRYFQELPQAQSMWEGTCFVFDDRIAINTDMSPSVLKKENIPEALHREKIRSRHDGFIYSKIMSISK